jgi:hypothetical protein
MAPARPLQLRRASDRDLREVAVGAYRPAGHVSSAISFRSPREWIRGLEGCSPTESRR